MHKRQKIERYLSEILLFCQLSYLPYKYEHGL